MVSVRWTALLPPECRHLAVRAFTSFRRAESRSDRLTDIPGRDHRQAALNLYGICPMSRHHALPESQALNFRNPLTELIDAPQLPGKAHLADGH